jgi:hypothetical protein
MRLGKFLKIAVVLSFFLPVFAVMPAGAANAAAEIELNFAEPNTPISGNVVRFGGVIANTGDISLSNLGVRVFLSPAINSRRTLNNELSTLGKTTVMRDTGLRIPITDLVPDQRATWSTAYLVDQLLTDGDGVYLIGFQLESDQTALDFKKVALPYRSSLESEITPVGISLLWPVASKIKTDYEGALNNEQLPESMISTGRLANILRAGQGNEVNWVLDPALVEFLSKSGEGYSIKNNSGEVSDGQYVDEVNLFFNSLQFSASANQTWVTPFAGSDIAALVRGEADSAFEQVLSIAKPLVERELATPIAGTITLAPFGAIPADVIASSYSQVPSIALVNDSKYSPIAGTLFTPSGFAEVNTEQGRKRILLNDSLLSGVFDTVVDTAEETVFFRQQLLSDTFLLANQLNDPERIIVVSPDVFWEPTLESSLVIAQTLTRAPWVRPVLLSEVVSKEIPNVLRNPFEYSAIDAAQELPVEHIQNIKKAQGLLADLAAIFTDQEPVDTYAKSILQASSTSFRANRREREAYLDSIISALNLSKTKVQILAQGSVVLPGDEGSIPITISNDLDQSILLKLSATSNPEIRFVAEDLGLIEVEPGAKKGVTLVGKVIGSGDVEVALQLLTPEDKPFGEPVLISVRSAAYSQVATWVAGIAFVALILLSINSFIRRRKESKINE